MTSNYQQHYSNVPLTFSTQDLKDKCTVWLSALKAQKMPNVIVPQSALKDTQLSIQFPD